MKISKEAIAKVSKQSINAVLILAGIATLGYGAWMIYHPAAYIVVGASMIWMGLPEK